MYSLAERELRRLRAWSFCLEVAGLEVPEEVALFDSSPISIRHLSGFVSAGAPSAGG